MSIATTAPEKYDFQDLVCLWLFLRFAPTELRAEFGGEDAQISLSGTSLPLDVQVKGAAGPITMDTLADVLTHFPPRSSTSPLLERLVASQAALLLVCAGRANDATSVIVRDAATWNDAGSSISIKDAQLLLEALHKTTSPKRGDAKLAAQRRAATARLLATLDASKLATISPRVTVFERMTRQWVDGDCERLLRARQVPVDKVRSLIDQLQATTRKNKGSTVDLVPLLEELVDAQSQPTIDPKSYVDREQESNWEAILKDGDCILLTGEPRCGKTWAARHLVASYQRNGYELEQGSSIEAAERFLSNPGTLHRIFLLEDPLGASEPAPDANRLWQRLGQLIAHLPLNRKLVVTQSAPTLLVIARQSTPARCSLGGRIWMDLSNPSSAFLLRVWDALADQYTWPKPASQAFRGALETGNARLPVGCLAHLASSREKIDLTTTVEQMISIASQDAQTFGRDLARTSVTMERLLIALAICTNAGTSVSETDLAFILDTKTTETPSSVLSDVLVVNFGAPLTTGPSRPTYRVTPSLRKKSRNALGELEQRSIIACDTQRNSTFGHPFYRGAAESLMRDMPSDLVRTAIAMFRNAITSPAPVISRAAARNLSMAIDVFGETLCDDIVDLAEIALESAFPSTRDLAFGFLASNVERLPEPRRKAMSEWAQKVAYVRLGSLSWQGSEPYLPLDGMTGGSERYYLSRPKVADVRVTLDALEHDNPGILGTREVVDALKFLTGHPNALTRKAFDRLFRFDEASIRSTVAGIWLQENRISLSETLETIFKDAHPNTASAVLEAVTANWASYDEIVRTRLLEELKGWAALPMLAPALLDFLVVFGRVEYTGTNTPWDIFGALLPVALATLPPEAHSNDARLYHAVESGLSSLSAACVLQIAEGWFGMLKRRLGEGKLPDDFALGVASLVLSSRETHTTEETDFLLRVLSVSSTGPLLVFIKDIVARWNVVHPKERQRLLRLLQSDRSDREWLRAVAISAERVPQEVEHVVLAGKVTLDASPEELLAGLPADLLSCVVHVFTGDPQPLWWLGVHHMARQRWKPLIALIATRPEHSCFEPCFQEVIDHEGVDKLLEVIAALPPASMPFVFDTLLRDKARRVGDFRPRAWSAVLNRLQGIDLDRALKQIDEAAPALLESVVDILELVDDTGLRRRILDCVHIDSVLLELSSVTLASDLECPKELVKMVSDLVVHLLAKAPARLEDTYDVLKRRFANAGAEPDILTMLEQHRLGALKQSRQLKDTLRSPDTEPVNWIQP
ncbi:hypothetical protein [Tahibacter soli]|uniref:Novel STAND NTPase 3 domain-containing protein n=1 Tax=Tahibacter soli TaxID=2983605 RepID=A0A9X3YKD0_9GAMM|nr:hypothetical protein [Tahibacter soli]MDC8012790.1 hypothetical protein [Tahibacter soli]